METLIENKLIKILETFDVTYVKIPSKPSLYKIYELFNTNVIFEAENDVEHLYLGVYYRNCKKDYKLMKVHYLAAIGKQNSSAMNNLAYYYSHIKSKYDKMKKYHLMGIKHGNPFSMKGLAMYYRNVDHDPELVVKYLLMAVENGHVPAMTQLAEHYEYKDEEKMKQYYDMAIEKGCTVAMARMGNWYRWNKEDIKGAKKYYRMMVEVGSCDGMIKMAQLYEEKRDYGEMKRFLLMAIDRGDTGAMFSLATRYYVKESDIENYKKYLKMGIDEGDQRALVELARYYVDKERNYVEAFNLYVKYPVAYTEQIRWIIKENPDFLVHILVGYKESKDLIRDLKVQIEDIKCKPDGEVYQDCRENWIFACSVLTE